MCWLRLPQTLQEELDARKELAMTAIRGTEDAVGAMQNNLKALREEKTQLKQELLQQRSEVPCFLSLTLVPRQGGSCIFSS